MSELVVLAFDNEEGAYQARDRLLEVRKRRMLQLADATVVVRRQDGKVQIKQLTNLVGGAAFGGAFWGVLVGLLFAVPWMGLAIGAAAGAVIGGLADYGVDDKFIKEVGATIEPGQSALFLLVHWGDFVKWQDELTDLNPTVLRTTLSPEQEAKLREAFGSEEADS